MTGNTPIPDACDFPGEYERMNAHLWQVFSLSASKRAVYPVVREQLNGLTESLKGASSHEEHKRLCAAAGNLFQIAGEIFFDSNRYTDSAHCYSLAANASKEAEEYDLWACALTRHAFIGMYERRFMDTVPLLEAAAAISRRGSSQLSTRYWVAAVQAEVFARLGDFESCRRSLDTAEQVLSLGGDVQNEGWLRFDGSRLAEERGTCYVALDRPDLAEAALTEALKSPLSSRRRSSVLIDLASLGIRRREIDRVISCTQAAIELGQRTNSGYVERKLHDLQAQLRPLLADKCVSALSQAISTLSRAGRY
jgi:tetratricopeptide (TPR) repeat protein